MIIKKRPVITWLLNPNENASPYGVDIINYSYPINYQFLIEFLQLLNQFRLKRKLGLPEMIMPSFEEVMRKSAPSFEKIIPELFKEFCKNKECGILVVNKNITIIYNFENEDLQIWYFIEDNDKSILKYYTTIKIINNQIRIGIVNSIISDNLIFQGDLKNRENYIGFTANFIIVYNAVKKYVKIEKVVIPEGKFTEIEGTPLEYLEKKKVINYSGQPVIVMDSKWFRKIINDNDIYVRGYWRMQNKKDENGIWYKELIFIDSFIRHGYHRNAKIEDINGSDLSEI